MNNVTFKVEGMHCSGCAATIQALLQHHEGVRKASASYEEREARVLYDSNATSEDQLAALIEKAGFRLANRSVSS